MLKAVAITAALVLFQSVGFASGKHKHHGKHEHGVAELSIAFERTEGKIEWKSPSEVVWGFEHDPKTDQQRKQVEEGLQFMANKMLSWVQLPVEAKCHIHKLKSELDRDGKHADVEVEIEVKCEQNMSGKSIQVHFAKDIERLKRVQIQALADDQQTSARWQGDAVTLSFK